jgi:spore coat-associated protein N
MKKRKKAALFATSGLIATSLLVGGATFAIFKSSVTNGSNNVQAGTLKITAKRDDVPNVGPMFYTENTLNNYGGMPTGLWAPGDKKTRGLFLENTGTLDARLTTLTVTPADSTGTAVNSGAQYDDDILFARQAKVIIWDIQEFDVLEGAFLPGIDSNTTANEMDFIMDIANIGYSMWKVANPNADLSVLSNETNLLTFINEYMFEELTKRGATADDPQFKIVKMYQEDLIDFVNTPFNATSFGIVLPPERAALLGFTVEFDHTPDAGIDNNSMQGKSVYFNFGSDWVQTKNN